LPMVWQRGVQLFGLRKRNSGPDWHILAGQHLARTPLAASADRQMYTHLRMAETAMAHGGCTSS
jgi:hypothetical protein